MVISSPGTIIVTRDGATVATVSVEDLHQGRSGVFPITLPIEGNSYPSVPLDDLLSAVRVGDWDVVEIRGADGSTVQVRHADFMAAPSPWGLYWTYGAEDADRVHLSDPGGEALLSDVRGIALVSAVAVAPSSAVKPAATPRPTIAPETGARSPGASAVISAANGGKLNTTDGKLTLDIPPGALGQDTEVSITLVEVGDLPQDLRAGAVGDVYLLRPEGLVFNEPVAVSLEFEPVVVIIAEGEGFEVHAVVSVGSDGEEEILDEIKMEIDPDNIAKLRGQLSHFSWITRMKTGIELSVHRVDPQRRVKGELFHTYVTARGKSVGVSASLSGRVILSGPVVRWGDQVVDLGPFLVQPNRALVETRDVGPIECTGAGKAAYTFSVDGSVTNAAFPVSSQTVRLHAVVTGIVDCVLETAIQEVSADFAPLAELLHK